MLGANFIECNEHCGVDGVRGVEESARDALHVFDAVFIKFWCDRGVGRLFRLGPIRRREPFVGRVLGERGLGVLEALQGFADGVGHGDVDVISRVVPFDGKPAVLAARWVDGDGVIFRNASRRWVVWLATKNLIPKSSTARVKVVSRVEWVQRPGVCATGE